MANSNLPLMFGALVAGSVVIDYGVKSFKTSFSGGGAVSSSPPGGSTLAAVPTGPTVGGPVGTVPLGSPAPVTGGGVVLDPGVQVTEGQEPQLVAALKKLASNIGQTIYVISGYRTPAQSVAVGGFADDPHTRGEAVDIGVGSSLRASAGQLTTAELAAVGLDRPFYPADPNEINHLQLIGTPG